MSFPVGSQITVREVLDGRLWAFWSETIVADDAAKIATLLATGTPLTFPDHPRPHPWGHLGAWEGTSVLKLRRPREWYAIWLFYVGGVFTNWYVNFEEPFVRQPDGIDVNDLQLDLVIEPDGTRRWKDVEHLAPSLASGRIDADQLHAVLEAAAAVVDLLDRDDRWWAPWDDWTPAAVED